MAFKKKRMTWRETKWRKGKENGEGWKSFIKEATFLVMKRDMGF